MILCITGMHRSGTSLIASWLESCGLTLYDYEAWGASVGNPKGHFEDKEFVALHSSAIKLKAPRSRGWKIFVKESLSFTGDHLLEAQELVNARNIKYDMWGWKDPRSVIFLKQWKAIIPELKVLLVWRPCFEVVGSLVNRSRKAKKVRRLRITELQAVKLWVRYNEKIYEYKRQYPDDTLLLPLDYIVRNDQTVFNFILKKFRLNLRYLSLSKLYDSRLLYKKSVSLWVRWFGLYYKSQILEEKLNEFSDFP